MNDFVFCFGECSDLAIIFPYTDRHVFFFPLQGQDNWCSKLMSKLYIGFRTSSLAELITSSQFWHAWITQLHQGAPPRGLREHVRTETGEFREQGILLNCFQGTTLLGSNFIYFQLQLPLLWMIKGTTQTFLGSREPELKTFKGTRWFYWWGARHKIEND